LYKDKKFNGYKERVCIKNKNILKKITNVIQNAQINANKAGEVLYLAKKLKEKYDLLHKIEKVTTNKKEPKVIDTISTGTGFIISKNGYILTNAHVIRGYSNIYAYVDKKRHKANIILVDSDNDIALLKIKGKFNYLPLNLKKAEVGEDITVIGYPNIGLQGNEIKATFGEINSLSGIQGDIRHYQIDAPIQPGNSGSPLLNMKGEVIGIVNATLNQVVMLKKTGTLAQNVNYAIKLSYALPLLYEANVKIIKPKQIKKLKKTELVKKVKKSIVLILAK
jgi:S1-C subfamily serine protease